MEDNTKKKVGLIGAINSPLSFFVLALLIVETFLGAALVGAHLDAELQKTCVYLGVAMFVLVVGIVAFITIVTEEPLINRTPK